MRFSLSVDTIFLTTACLIGSTHAASFNKRDIASNWCSTFSSACASTCVAPNTINQSCTASFTGNECTSFTVLCLCASSNGAKQDNASPALFQTFENTNLACYGLAENYTSDGYWIGYEPTPISQSPTPQPTSSSNGNSNNGKSSASIPHISIGATIVMAISLVIAYAA